jgi:hypothetical protein
VAAEAIRELSTGIDKQMVILEDIKQLLIDLTDGLSEHRAHTITAIDDLGARVRQMETRLR